MTASKHTHYLLVSKKNLQFFIFPNFKKIKYLIYGFTTKNWTQEAIIENFAFRKDSIVSLRQIHSDKFYIVDRKPEKILAGDALITDKPGFLLTVRTADCLPILLFDYKKEIIAAIHSGWKGTVKKITLKVIQEMKKIFEIKPSSLFALLGPCICQKCYEVDEDVKKAFKENWKYYDSFLIPCSKKDKYNLNLRKANLLLLEQAGIKSKNIYEIDLCSKCYPHLFFSYRREPKSKGRMLAFIGIKKY